MKRFWTIMVILLAMLVGLYFRPLPKAQAVEVKPDLPAVGRLSIPWPDYGQSAIGAVGYGVLGSNGQQKAVPIASIAKIVTALAVLQKKPLEAGQQGPDLTISSTDIALYNKYVAEQGSVVPVNDGEEISEYQMLQAMLLPSGNNIADSLANWAFGSQAAYLTYANDFVKTLGLSHTTLTDASGFSPKSVSSASDLVILGEKAMANPLLASVVGQSHATLPVVGSVSNVNWLLGSDGVVGIKTGNTDQAGGCFLYAANRTIGGQKITVVGAVLGAPNSNNPNQAIDDSQTIIEASDNNFHPVLIAKKGEPVGTYKTAWGKTATAVAGEDLTVVSWNGANPKIVAQLEKLSGSAAAGQKAGSLNVTTGQKTQSLPVVLQQKVAAPSLFWRIFHI